VWDAAALVAAVLRNYERLPKEIQAEPPLKRLWALVLEE
jgi:restriction system protein